MTLEGASAADALNTLGGMLRAGRDHRRQSDVAMITTVQVKRLSLRANFRGAPRC